MKNSVAGVARKRDESSSKPTTASTVNRPGSSNRIGTQSSNATQSRVGRPLSAMPAKSNQADTSEPKKKVNYADVTLA